jgi:hypothetical protein
MVLHRMSDFIMSGGAGRRVIALGRVVMAAVATGNIAGLAGNIAASVNYERVAVLLTSASLAASSNNTEVARQNRSEAFAADELAFRTSSLQAFCEAIVLLLIIATFTVAGAASLRRMSKISEVCDEQYQIPVLSYRRSSPGSAARLPTPRLSLAGSCGVRLLLRPLSCSSRSCCARFTPRCKPLLSANILYSTTEFL